MATVKEANLQGKDAAASVDTMAVMSVGDMFDGTLDGRSDVDWVKVELKAGMTYVITLTGRKVDLNGNGNTDDTNEADTLAEDPILELRDSKGGIIDMNDDMGPGSDNLDSKITRKIEEDGTYYIAASSYTGNPEADNSGGYTINVMALDLPADIEGTANADKLKGTDDGESIMGNAGNDTIDGMGGDDEIEGNEGNDLITGGAGADKISGGDGMDTISYMYSPAGVSVNLGSGAATGGDAEGDMLGTDIENVIGSMFDDSLVGVRRGARDNKLWGLDGDDDLSGDKGKDELYGGAGDDMLDGGEGDDMLEGGAGMDTLTGGAGNDTASYMGSMMGVTVRLHNGQLMGGDAEGDMWGGMVTANYTLKDADGKDVKHTETVPDIENLTGSNMADILAGDSRVNTIKGMGGDDMLYGGPGGGDDNLYGGGGMDGLYGGHGADMLDGGAGNDTLYGGGGNDTFYGGYGSDMIYADTSDAMIDGFVKDQVTKGDNSEGIQYNGKTVTEAMDRGNSDTVTFERSKTGIGSTSDPWSLGDEAKHVENLIGSDADDWLGGENDKDNVIEGRDGADDLDGGTGTGSDTVSYRSSDRGVTIDLSASTNKASGGHAAGDTIANFENVTGSAHSDTLTGDNNANVLKGLAGGDELFGGTGGDTLEGGAGADELDGGTNADDKTARSLTTYNPDGTVDQQGDGGKDRDSDTVSYAGSDAGVNVNLATLSFSGGHAEGDEDEGAEKNAFDPDGPGDMEAIDVSSFENVTGSMYNDTLTGDHRENKLDGGGGDDSLSGGADKDTLTGGPGADRLDGGKSLSTGGGTATTADDIQHVDTASYAGAMAGVTVNLDSMRGTAGDAEGDTYVSIEKFVGSGHDDVFIASEGVDTIDGGGNTGDTTPGDTTDDGIGDTVSYELSEEPVSVDLSQTVQSADNVDPDPVAESYAKDDSLTNIENVTGSSGNDTLKGNDNANVLSGGGGKDTLEGGGGKDTLMGGDGDDIKLDGGGGDDKLMGGAGNDTLIGGADNDTLDGGTGIDELDGGSGNNTFVFGPDKATAGDYINNWSAGTNKIDLSAFGIKADDFKDLVSLRGTDNLQINLNDYGGGTVMLVGISDFDELDGANGTDNDAIDGDLTADGSAIIGLIA